MKKTITVALLCLTISICTFGQKLNQKDAKKILETAFNAVKANDSSSFIKLWIIDKEQWPYHTYPFTVNEIKNNFYGFKTYLDSAITKNMKFDEVECDTVAKADPHGGFAKYYIRGWFKYSAHHRKGFGFYMDYVGDKWLVRFSPDYSEDTRYSGKKK
ncbi:MAG TPA: hypothetical protein VK808_12475 [Bacteroidia bacterium]|jgi:hypothetical protein|nr:hypothetical protein [Bacteroidia bacterium]